MKNNVKKLWELCFNDSKAFTELYFTLRYRDDINLCIEKENDVIAAMQLIPYDMIYFSQIIPTTYISGACTHPEHRKQGIMGNLLAEALTHMYHNGTILSTLIPAEPWLFDYYAKFGYLSTFQYCRECFNCQTQRPIIIGNCTLLKNCLKEETVCFIRQKQAERNCYLLHSEEDFKVILEDLNISGGHTFTLVKEKEIVAAAIAYPGNNSEWRVDELVYNSSIEKEALLSLICKELKQDALSIIAPHTENEVCTTLGMARIIHAEKALQHYAIAFPQEELHIHLTDKLIAENNGYYSLSNGMCMKHDTEKVSTFTEMSIEELTQKLFATHYPYMNLMLN